MRIRVAIDVSGLAWRYRTGVQNLYWAFVQAWQENPDLHDRFELRFYDRSGLHNAALQERAGAAYSSAAPRGWPAGLRRPLQALIRCGLVPGPDLRGTINHVWNWGLYAPAGVAGSITVPDLLPIEFPQWYNARFRRLTQNSLRYARERAQYVFAISEYVKQRLVDDAGIAAERVRVVYPGIDPRYFAAPEPAATQALLQRHGLQPGRYLLSSGFLDPRKNLARQLQAFALATRQGDTDVKYALTGLENAQSGPVLELMRDPALRQRVVFLGYVPQDQLPGLMAGSAALMYCSIAEGFGLPIIEAMASGALVLTAHTSSMQELAQGRALTVDPFQVEDIAAKIALVLGAERSQWLARVPDNRAFAARFTVRNWLTGHLAAYAGQTPAGAGA